MNIIYNMGHSIELFLKTVFITLYKTYGHQYYSKFERNLLSMVGILLKLFPYQILLKSIARKSTITEEASEIINMGFYNYVYYASLPVQS